MTSADGARAAPIRSDLVIFAVIVALALAALGYVLSQRQQVLRSSPVGLDGLQLWLASEGGSAQVFSGGWVLDRGSIGLLVVPLHDTRPDERQTLARTQEELLFQEDENDLDWTALREKIDRVPALVVLPKWRSGMRLTGIAHPALLVEERRLDALMQRLTGQTGMPVNRIRRVFTALPYTQSDGTVLTAELYAAQLFDGSACDPIIGSGAETLLASCPLAGRGGSVLVLSDPDLLNNHGLRLGQNAAIARDFLLGLAAGDTVLIDYSEDNWIAEDDAPITRERSWSDLLRFFQPPFLALWLATGMVLALALWRAAVRGGPVRTELAERSVKMQAVGARARLMRLTGQDGAMLGDYAAARIAATAARLVGPGQARHIGEESAFLRYLARRRPHLSLQLEAALQRLRALPPRIPAAEAIRQVDELELILEQIANDP